MVKELTADKFAKVNEEMLQKLEKVEYDVMPVGDAYHEEDEYIRTQYEFIKDETTGKWKRDESKPPQYHEVALLCSSREKELKNVTLKVRVPVDKMDIVDGHEVDDAVRIKFDRQLTGFSANQKGALVLELYVAEMKEVGDNAQVK